MKSSRSEFVPIRNLRYHVRHWGSPDAPKLFMLHGWMDVSASFQFVVDCLRQDWHVIAPDWRGFGLTEFSGTDCYWFPDYLGDLDALIRHYSASEPIHLLGHSMGGNVACVYAGVRPTRINKLVNLEGFGLPAAVAEQAPGRYAKWLDELQHPPGLRSYANREEVAARLQKTNPRLTDARAAFLAGHWAAPDEQGEWHVLGDPAHRMVNPVLYRLDEILACWRRIAAPVLWVEAEDTEAWGWMGGKDKARPEIDRRIASIPKVQTATIQKAGHMLHHDQPEALAAMIERFLA